MLRMAFTAFFMLLASAAKADVFVIAPPYYEGTDGQALSDELVRLVTEDLERQHEIVGPKQAASLVPKEHRVSCAEGECAERYREAAGAVAAIVIRVGRAGVGPGPATSFQLGIQPAPGVEYTQGALLSDGPLKDIAVRALREAFRDYRDPGPWLTVSGAPGGASVYVDDRAVGVLPWTDRLPLGTHRVRVEARGFEPMIKIVGLMSPTERKRLDFRLEPARVASSAQKVSAGDPQDNGSTKPDRSATEALRNHRWSFVTGLSVTAAGLVGTSLGAYYKHRAGQCADGQCDQVYGFEAGQKAMLGGGIALVVGGAALLILSETRWKIRPAVDARSVGLWVGRSL